MVWSTRQKVYCKFMELNIPFNFCKAFQRSPLFTNHVNHVKLQALPLQRNREMITTRRMINSTSNATQIAIKYDHSNEEGGVKTYPTIFFIAHWCLTYGLKLELPKSINKRGGGGGGGSSLICLWMELLKLKRKKYGKKLPFVQTRPTFSMRKMISY